MPSFSNTSSLINCLGKLNLFNITQTILINRGELLKKSCCNRLNVYRSFCVYRSSNKKPKKPLSPFFKYIQAIEADLKIEFPGVYRKDLLKIAGERWHNIDPQEKAIYQKEFNASKREYNLKMREFYAEEDAEYLKLKMELDDQYKHSDTESDIEQAAQHLLSLERYEQSHYESRIDNEEKRRELSQLKKARKRAGAPSRPVSAYNIFLKDYYKEQIDPGLLTVSSKAAAIAWRSMDPASKMEYEKKFQESLMIYQDQFAVWAERMVEEGRADELGIESINV